jgi:hypothetical protein
MQYLFKISNRQRLAISVVKHGLRCIRGCVRFAASQQWIGLRGPSPLTMHDLLLGQNKRGNSENFFTFFMSILNNHAFLSNFYNSLIIKLLEKTFKNTIKSQIMQKLINPSMLKIKELQTKKAVFSPPSLIIGNNWNFLEQKKS